MRRTAPPATAMTGRRHRIDRTGLLSGEPQISTLEDRLLADHQRLQGTHSGAEEPADHPSGLMGQVAGIFNRLSGAGRGARRGASPSLGGQAGTGLHRSGASSTAKEARVTLDSLAMFPGGTAADVFNGSDDEESEADDETDEEEENIVRYLQGKLSVILLTLVSLAVIGLSIFVQVMPWSYATIGKNAVYVRWACFAGTLVPVYYTMRKLLSRLFVLIELRLFRDSLAYLSNLKEASVNVVFAYVELAVFYIIFHVAFCFGKFEKTCEDPVYVARSVVGMKCLLCLGLFLTASWLACLASKMLSTHFYKSTHFKKFREALNREYVLHALSMPKRKVIQLHNSQMGMSEAAAASEVLRDGGGFSGTLPGYASPHGMSRPNKPGAAPSSAVAIGMNGAAGQRGEEGRESAAASFSTGFPAATLGTVEEEPEPNAHLLKEAGLAREQPKRGGSSMLISDSVRLENALTADMLRAVPMAVNEEVTMDELENEDKLERLRTAVVVKTYSKLMEHYRSASAETAAVMMKNVKAFSGALFKNLSGSSSSRRSVILTDFELFFPNTEEGRVNAVKAFELFDVSNDGRVTKAEVKEVVMNIFRDRANIAGSLIDTDSIVQSLEQGFSGLIHFLFVGLYLLVWSVATQTLEPAATRRFNGLKRNPPNQTPVPTLSMGPAPHAVGLLRDCCPFFARLTPRWAHPSSLGTRNINVVAGFATFSATLVGLSFIFGNSIRTIFESLVFLFSRHPYDVGDWVVINCEKYQIKKARLLFTMMVNIAGHPVYMSNSELNNKQIDNLSRSTSHTDYNAIEVDMGAAESVKREIKARLDEHIRANANDFEGRSTVFLQNLERADLKATLQVFFTMNYPGDHFERLIATRDAAYQVISDVIGRCRRDGHLQHTQARTVRLVGDAPSAPAQAAAPDRRVGS
mmetsp:Transcript_13836/g.34913  ORF Transcript_13836/g.34913 Transcript_13836/m.34913 type:complete len:921 (-) Transcript_13836:438-3200(-)